MRKTRSPEYHHLRGAVEHERPTLGDLINLEMDGPEEFVRKRFAAVAIPIDGIGTKCFAGEVIVIVLTSKPYMAAAQRLASEIDGLIENGFVVVQQSVRSNVLGWPLGAL